MEKATHPQVRQTVAPDQTRSPRHLMLWITLWIIGVIALAILAFTVHTYPKPWPGELNITNFIQGSHPVPCTYNPRTRSWLDSEVDFINSLNDPIQSVAIPVFWMVVLMIFRGFRQAIFLAIAVLTSSSMWAALAMLVMRPRATPADGICVHRAVAAYSFPSGHVMHDVVLYGFLLYLSFSLPVRRWRYRWVLLPLQILAVLYMLAVGYARIEAGEHHPIDVLGAYLAAILWLFLFIFLYRWTTDRLAERRIRKSAHIA